LVRAEKYLDPEWSIFQQAEILRLNILEIDKDEVGSQSVPHTLNREPCVGDGNLDGVVDQQDIDQFNYWANVTSSNSSWYDLNLDGLTNQADVPYITQGNFPRECPMAHSR